MFRNFLKMFLAITVVCLAAAPAMAQYTTFIVDDDGNPATTYPSLAAAIATAQTFSGGPHKIVIKPGNYSDFNLTPNPAKIDQITCDALPGEVVFTSPAGINNFITLGLDQHLAGMTLVGYAGYGVNVVGNNVIVEDLVIVGASGTGVYVSGASNALVQNLALSNLQYGVFVASAATSTFDNISAVDCDYGMLVYNLTGVSWITDVTALRGDYGIVVDGGSAGFEIQNARVDSVSTFGIYFNSVGGSRIENSLVNASGGWGILALNSTAPNWVRYNCLINNTGVSQGYDDGIGGNWWDGNFYGDNVYTLGAVTDGNPMKYTLTAVASGSSYNIGDIIDVDFMWSMPACAGLDSQLMAAYNFVVNWDDTKLAYVAGSADYDEAYLGPAPPALYTGISETSTSLTFAAANFTTPGLDGGRLGFAQFEVIGANAVSSLTFTGDDFRDPANNTVPHTVAATSFTLVDNVAPVLVSVTANNPAGDDTYSDGSVAGLPPFLKLELTMSATDNYDLDKFQWNSNGGVWSDWIPVPGAHPLVAGTSAPTQYDFVWLGLPEGTHTAGVRVKDAAGNISNEIFYTYHIDRTAPVISAIAVTDKDGCALNNSRWTNDQTVTVAITATGDPYTMMLSESGDQPIVPFAASSDFMLSATNGPHVVWARLYDKYNNRVDWTPGNVINLDNVAPVAVGPLAINGGAAKTNNPNVAITLLSWGFGWGDGEVNITENSGDLVCGGAGWFAPTSYPHTFTLSAGEGVKTVYFATRDSAGNVSAILSDAIEVDQTPVTITSYDMVDDAGFTCSNDGNIKALYSWTGADAQSLEWSYDGISWGNWKSLVGLPSPDSTNGAVPNANGMQYLYIRIVDDIGNYSAAVVDSIMVDNVAPALTNMVVADAAATATPDPTDPQYSNSVTFNMNITGLSADVTVLRVSENNFTTYTDFPIVSANPYTLSYSYAGTANECAAKTMWIKALDCAGNESVFDSDVFRFDFAAPVLTSFTGPAITNTQNVTLAIAATDNCGLYRMRLGEGSLFGVPWVPFNVAPSFTLAAGDGNHVVNLEVADRGGNIVTGSVTIMLDATVPSAGTFVIVSPNLLAVPGYTSTLVGNYANITWDGDVVSMWIQYADGSFTGEIPVVTPYTLAIPNVPAGPGVKTVNYWFKDAALNWSPMYMATIDYSNVPPPPPTAGTATGTPTASCLLQWGAVTDAQKYTIRYNFQNQYPIYQDPIPPHPMDRLLEGILATDTVTGLQYLFEGTQPDIYSFSIWTLSKHGLYSTTPNVDVTATNYILGDFAPTPDGCIDFGDEFGALAVAYNSISSDPNYNMYLDIAPTIDFTPTGYPDPDQAIDFEDLVIFALNYDQYFCTGEAPAQPAEIRETAKLKAGPLAVEADIPTRVRIGDEFVVPVRIADYEAVKAFHVILGLNTEMFEVVGINAGSAFEGIKESFFYSDPNSSQINVSGVVFGRDVAYTSDEFFTVTLKARATGDVNLEGVELTFRDRENKNFEASLSFNRVVNGSLPNAFALSQNYPNPFNPTTTIELALPQASEYTLTIYNVLGQAVKTFQGFAEAGYVSVEWNATDQSSGIYLYKVVAGRFEDTKKMVLIK